jgi:hypothetical protein
VERSGSPDSVGRGVSLGLADGGSCESLNRANFTLLASSFRACAAAVSKADRSSLETGLAFTADWVAVAPLSLPEVEKKVWPAPEL